jgi:hydrogenase expression/formation protein HypC
MCLAIPALITSVEGTTARAEIGGVEREISVALTPEAQVGDYVLMHTGFAIGVIDKEEALETLRLLEELAEFYPDEDVAGGTGTVNVPSAPVE